MAVILASSESAGIDTDFSRLSIDGQQAFLDKMPKMRKMDFLMKMETEARLSALLLVDEFTLQRFCEKVSVIDGQSTLSQNQKNVLLKLVASNHIETIKKIQASPKLSQVIGDELELHRQHFGLSTTVSSSTHCITQENILQVLMYIKASQPVNEVRKIKAADSELPFSFHYNQQESDIAVKVRKIDEGEFKVAKQWLHISATACETLAIIKHVVKKMPIEDARDEVRILELVKDVPHVIQLLKSQEYVSKKWKLPAIKLWNPYYNLGKLETCLDEDTLNYQEKLQSFLEIVKGIKYLHAKQILHRDIKPSNILLHQTVEKGKRVVRTYIADFGLACEYTSERRNKFAGSPTYMPPALLIALRDKVGVVADYAMDIWAAGLTSQEMFQGYNSFGYIRDPNDLIKSGLAKGDRLKNSPPHDENSIDFVTWKMIQPDVKEQMTLDEAIAKTEALIT